MATIIHPRHVLRYCSVRNRIVPQVKLPWLLVTFALSLVLFASYVSHNREALVDVRPHTTKVMTVQDKMVDYMRSINPRLGLDVAYELADAIISREQETGLPKELQLGLITVESHFDQYAISKAGALGFWQVMPNWHYDKVLMVAKDGLSKNIYDPRTQSVIGSKILHDCLNKHHGNLKAALLCYNGSQNDESARYAHAVISVAEEIRI